MLFLSAVSTFKSGSVKFIIIFGEFAGWCCESKLDLCNFIN